MARSKDQLKVWIVEALQSEQREMSVVEVAKYVWEAHEDDLRESGDLFYTWQYDLRWAAQTLRDEGVLSAKNNRRKGGWALA